MSQPSKNDRPTGVDRTRNVRLYAGIGVAFWAVAAVVAYVQGASTGTVIALALLAAAIAVGLLVGWFHEPAGAVVMLAAAVSTVAYGLLVHWDLAFWGMMLVSVTGPLLIAAYLFDAVRRDSRDAERPEPAERTESTESSAPTGTRAPRAF
jgi:hypothetical protein